MGRRLLMIIMMKMMELDEEQGEEADPRREEA